MIEMLGVLAIIGVLSVGGIAGYSKAMTQFKVNKIIAETNQMIADAHEYALKDKSFRIPNSMFNKDINIRKSLGLCPENWKNCEYSGLGNIRMDTNRISFFNLKYPELCLAAINNIAIPLKETVETVYLSSKAPEYEDAMDECMGNDYECIEGADGIYYLKIKNNYIGDDDNKYDESSKKGTLEFNDPRLISAVASICRGKNSSVQIYFKKGFIGIYN